MSVTCVRPFYFCFYWFLACIDWKKKLNNNKNIPSAVLIITFQFLYNMTYDTTFLNCAIVKQIDRVLECKTENKPIDL